MTIRPTVPRPEGRGFTVAGIKTIARYLSPVFQTISAQYQNGISSSKSIGGSLDGAAGAGCCGRAGALPLN